jgi:GNAT superfamily N-acetyltransferase
MEREPVVTHAVWNVSNCPENAATGCELRFSWACPRFGHDRIAIFDRSLSGLQWESVRTFVRRMERDDLRLRFGHPFDHRDEATLRRFFDITGDGCAEMIWSLDRDGSIAGIGHRIRVSAAEAEIGLIVRSDLKRRGIGEFLLRTMLSRAAKQGLKTLSAVVLRENRALLNLAAKVGYVSRPGNPFTVEIAFELHQAMAASTL